MLAFTRQRDTEHQAWRTRYGLARLIASQGRLDEAAAIAQAVWRDSAWNPGVGILVFQLNASREDLPACRRTLDQLRAHASPRDLALQRALVQFEAFVAETAAPRPDAAPGTTP
jgi:hypothetical protein